MFWQRSLLSVTFATSCWERDWRLILLDPDYLRVRQIENHRFPFQERLLIINNVHDLTAVKKAADAKVKEGVLTRYVVADELTSDMLPFFQLRRSDFQPQKDSFNVNSDWIYYNALGPLSALYAAKSDYLLYMTGDVRLDKRVNWIARAVRRMEKKEIYKVANLTWNAQYGEAKRESYKREPFFYVAKQGFSDQLFLVKRKTFCQPIYGEIRPDSGHYPRGDVFEKRVFSFMKTH
ncbi:MAG: hypothetical protein V4487_03875, partial [Chlamydiota bacterium]